MNAFYLDNEPPARNQTWSLDNFKKLSRPFVSGNVCPGSETEPNDMSNKVANLIAVELAVLIALMAWRAFSNLRSVQAPALAQEPSCVVDSFATVVPVRQTRLPAPVDYRADLAPEPAPEEAPPQFVQEYEQTIADEPYVDLDAGDATATSPSYAAVEPEPLFASPDCLFAPVDRFVVYPQSTAFVVISNSRNVVRRPRPPIHQNNANPTVMQRRPLVSPPSRGGGRSVVPRQKSRLHFPRPNQKPGPRQNP